MERKLDLFDKIMFSACTKGDNDHKILFFLRGNPRWAKSKKLDKLKYNCYWSLRQASFCLETLFRVFETNLSKSVTNKQGINAYYKVEFCNCAEFRAFMKVTKTEMMTPTLTGIMSDVRLFLYHQCTNVECCNISIC